MHLSHLFLLELKNHIDQDLLAGLRAQPEHLDAIHQRLDAVLLVGYVFGGLDYQLDHLSVGLILRLAASKGELRLRLLFALGVNLEPELGPEKGNASVVTLVYIPQSELVGLDAFGGRGCQIQGDLGCESWFYSFDLGDLYQLL